jgi:lipoyl(octanoyl) transferase
MGLSLREYIHCLVEAFSDPAEFGLKVQINGATGVWLDPETQDGHEKYAISDVKASRYVTMHGFAFNVTLFHILGY